MEKFASPWRLAAVPVPREPFQGSAEPASPCHAGEDWICPVCPHPAGDLRCVFLRTKTFSVMISPPLSALSNSGGQQQGTVGAWRIPGAA